MQEIGLQSGLQTNESGYLPGSQPGLSGNLPGLSGNLPGFDPGMEQSKRSLVPWLFVVVPVLALFYLLPKQLQAIHSDVNFGIRSLLATTDAKNIDVAVDGRDVELSGKISPKFDRDFFVQSLQSLQQINSVSDDLQEHDPRQEARRLRADFQVAVRGINTGSIRFEPNSASFSSSSDAALDELFRLLKQHPERRIKVAGHTDTSGPRQANLTLSRQRASAVTDYLGERGIPREQLLSQGYGSSQPIASNDTEIGRSKNRRIEIIVMN